MTNHLQQFLANVNMGYSNTLRRYKYIGNWIGEHKVNSTTEEYQNSGVAQKQITEVGTFGK
jgi:hypothetical protein